MLDHKPDAVFTVASLTHKEAPFETEVPEYLEGIKPFTDAGMDVVGIRDNPRFSINMPECVQKNGPDAAECNAPLQESLAGSSPLDAYRGKVPGLHLMDLSDFICADGICPAVVGQCIRLQGRQPSDQDVRPDHDPHVRKAAARRHRLES